MRSAAAGGGGEEAGGDGGQQEEQPHPLRPRQRSARDALLTASKGGRLNLHLTIVKHHLHV